MMIATILFVLACSGNGGGEKKDDFGSPGGDVDADGDGAFGEDDCNDAAPDVHPDAEETCNGIDDDCNGTVDDDLIFDFFRDSDGDGYGDAETSGSACTLPDGWVTDATDCDDEAAGVNPGQQEVCDVGDVDEDCNGLANEDDPGVVDIQTWFVDEDDDGFGLAGTSVEACFDGPGLASAGNDCDDTDPNIGPGTPEVCDPADVDEDCDGASDEEDPEGPMGESRYYVDVDADDYGDALDPGQFFCDGVPAGYVTAGEDCDDAEPLVNPGARENCGDGIDNDCKGGIDDCGPLADLDLMDSDTTLEATAGIPFHGMAVADLGDVNGDGLGDFATCGWNFDNVGRVWIFEGPAPTGDADPDSAASETIDGDVTFGMFATTAAGAGDVNGDDFDDVLVGQNNFDGSAGYLWLGPVTSTTSTTADATWSGEVAGDLAGKAVAGDFDFDDDGFGDYLVGAEGADDGTFTFGGAAFLIYGPGTGSNTIGDADLRFTGTTAGSAVGRAIAGIADMDGDGRDEIAIGAAADGGSVGRAYLFYGASLSGELLLEKTADVAYEGGVTLDMIGDQVSRANDVNGDGYGDLLVAGPRVDTGVEDGGSVYVIAGPGDTGGAIDAIATAEIFGEAAFDMIGYSLDGTADVNGDGFSDLLIGAPYTDFSAAATEAGTAYFLYGPQTGDVSVADARCAMTGSVFQEIAGVSVAFIGDQTGDGTAELLVGAPYLASGTAYVVAGERM